MPIQPERDTLRLSNPLEPSVPIAGEVRHSVLLSHLWVSIPISIGQSIHYGR